MELGVIIHHTALIFPAQQSDIWILRRRPFLQLTMEFGLDLPGLARDTRLCGFARQTHGEIQEDTFLEKNKEREYRWRSCTRSTRE